MATDNATHTQRQHLSGVVPAAEFSYRPPSPPYIHVPTLIPSTTTVTIAPPYHGHPDGGDDNDDIDGGDENDDGDGDGDGGSCVGGWGLTAEELAAITQGRTQTAEDGGHTWRYEMRRAPQCILDFLYLGPASAARDRTWLEAHGITMLLVARDARLARARLMSVDRAARALGLLAEYVDVSSNQELIRALPTAVKRINDHLLGVHRGEAAAAAAAAAAATTAATDTAGAPGVGQAGQAAEAAGGGNGSGSRRGKVLVLCETGNDRSAAIVAAYIMTVFGKDVISTIQFVSLQRFCCNFDEDTKQLLQTYGDILGARRTVYRQTSQARAQARERAQAQAAAAAGVAAVGTGTGTGTAEGAGPGRPQARASTKRGIDDAFAADEDVDMGGAGGFDEFAMDRDRYVGREAFMPYREG